METIKYLWLVGLTITAGALVALLAGCDGDGGGGGAADAAPDGGAGGDSASFIVVVWEDDAYTPLEGAQVAFDGPDGTRAELTTDADGVVTFEGIDWTLGTAAATAFAPDYTLSSYVNLDASTFDAAFQIDGAVVLLVYPLEEAEPETVDVSGTFTGAEDTGRDFYVNVLRTTFGTEWSGNAGDEFSVEVPVDEPFTLQLLETESLILDSDQGYELTIHQVAHQAFDAIDADLGDVALDFTAGAMPLSTADASLDLPAREDSPVRDGYGVGLVCSQGSTYCHGWSNHVEVVPDNDLFEVSLAWTEPEWSEGPAVLCYVLQSFVSVTAISGVYLHGYPEGGSLGALLDTPEWTSSSTMFGFGDLLEWELFDEVELVMLQASKGQQYVWGVVAPANSTSLALPDPPSAVDAAELLGTGTLQVELIAGDVDYDLNRWTRWALSPTAGVQM